MDFRAHLLTCFGLLAISLLATSCSKRVPNELAPIVDANLPLAIRVAEDAAKSCPALKASAPFQPNPMAAPPPPPSPAKGSPLESDTHVVDVLITCNWPDPRDSTGNTTAGSSFPKLKDKVRLPERTVTVPEDFAKNTCPKNHDSCEQVVVPSRYLTSESTADIRITRKTVDGSIEVVVILAP